MFEFLSLKQEAFGLDISDLLFKIVKLKKKRNSFELDCFGEFDIKPGIIDKGEIKNEQALVEIIRNSLSKVKGGKLKTRYVIASLPEEESFLQVIEMPIMDKEELKTAVLFEAENYIPLPMDQVYLDFKLVEPDCSHLDHMDVLIAALPKKTVDSYLSVLKKAGLKPLAFEIESEAIVRALIDKKTMSSRVLIIDIGATRTSFIIFAGSNLRFTVSIPICGRTFDEIIAKNFGIDVKEAEKMKIKYGLDRKAKKGKIFDSLIPCLTDLTEQIEKYLNYYYTHTSREHMPVNGKAVEKILLCGASANLKGLDKFLADYLKIPVVLGNPWVNILTEPAKGDPMMPLKKSLGQTTALGLALRGAAGSSI